MSLLKLPPEMQDSIADGRITVEQGKSLVSVDIPAVRQQIWNDLLKMKLGRDDTREYVRAAKTLTSRPHAAAQKDADWQDMEEKFKRAFSAKVEITPAKSGGGTLTIKYANQEHLESILERQQGK